jgi:chromosome segregation ATPase
MPNGFPTQTSFPSAPFPAPARAPSSFMAPKRLPPEIEDFQKKVSEQTSDLSSRVKLIEERIENLRNHLDLVDGSLVEKHKSLVSNIRDLEDGMRGLRADMDMLKELAERLAKRMEAFASKEELKIIERYVSLWQPMNFVTRAEVKAAVQNILKEQGFKIAEEA